MASAVDSSGSTAAACRTARFRGHTHNSDGFSFAEGRDPLCNLSSGLGRSFGRLRARRSGPDADGALSVSLSRIQPSHLLRAYFFCAFESQNEGSLATHSPAGMLNSGRTAKILASGPAADSFASASVRVFAAVTTNRNPS